MLKGERKVATILGDLRAAVNDVVDEGKWTVFKLLIIVAANGKVILRQFLTTYSPPPKLSPSLQKTKPHRPRFEVQGY